MLYEVITFFDNADYRPQLSMTAAEACLVSARFEDEVPAAVIVLRVEEPYRAFVTVARALFPDSLRPSSMFEAKEIAAGALVHPTARLEGGVTIDPRNNFV